MNPRNLHPLVWISPAVGALISALGPSVLNRIPWTVASGLLLVLVIVAALSPNVKKQS